MYQFMVRIFRDAIKIQQLTNTYPPQKCQDLSFKSGQYLEVYKLSLEKYGF